MADSIKVLAQSAPSATTLTDIYTVPASTSTIVRCMTVCNRSSTATTFRVSVAIAGAADTNAQYVVYDRNLDGNESCVISLPITLAATDKVRAYVGAATVSINLFGMEIT